MHVSLETTSLSEFAGVVPGRDGFGGGALGLAAGRSASVVGELRARAGRSGTLVTPKPRAGGRLTPARVNTPIEKPSWWHRRPDSAGRCSCHRPEKARTELPHGELPRGTRDPGGQNQPREAKRQRHIPAAWASVSGRRRSALPWAVGAGQRASVGGRWRTARRRVARENRGPGAGPPIRSRVARDDVEGGPSRGGAAPRNRRSSTHGNAAPGSRWPGPRPVILRAGEIFGPSPVASCARRRGRSCRRPPRAVVLEPGRRRKAGRIP